MKTRLYAVKRRYVLAACILAIAALAVFGDKGLIDLYRLRKERDGILSHNADIAAENASLEKDIRLLKANRRYIKSIARKELGMIGRNEVVYRFEERAREGRDLP
ncbi:MAG: septum formation initiator family protein [Deltaproteobacteria bacterium]|nr:septum formation initiator family protein [Deltaproteobacteria bacterium]